LQICPRRGRVDHLAFKKNAEVTIRCAPVALYHVMFNKAKLMADVKQAVQLIYLATVNLALLAQLELRALSLSVQFH
jgi:hypothetical protein